MWHVWAFTLLFVVSTAYALWRGGAPERIAALLLFGGGLASILAASAAKERWANPDLGLLIVDGLMLAGALALVVRANRLWPILMAALLVVQVTGHLLKALDPQLYPFLYWLTSSLWAWIIQTLLMIATRNHRVRLKQRGHDASWRGSSRPSTANSPNVSPEI